jgi:hypothetical protein
MLRCLAAVVLVATRLFLAETKVYEWGANTMLLFRGIRAVLNGFLLG